MDLFDDDGNPVDKNGNPTEAKCRKRGPEKITDRIRLWKWDSLWIKMESPCF